MIFDILKWVLAFAGIFFTLYGFLHFMLCIRKGKGGIDKSNVWNRLMAVTYVAMHPEVFGNIQFFKNDVGENIRLVEEAVLSGSMRVGTMKPPINIEDTDELIKGSEFGEAIPLDENGQVNHAANLPRIDG